MRSVLALVIALTVVLAATADAGVTVEARSCQGGVCQSAPPELAPPLPEEEAHMPVLRSVLVKPFVYVHRHRPRLFWRHYERRPILRYRRGGR
ncbi:MAG: hypothetical protein ACYSWU_16270 [Planctomycetota bacterium]|jgi:hypothetical protein